MDSKLEFSDAQVISCSSASASISTNVFQMAALKDAWGTAITHDIGNGGELVANVQIATVLNASSYIVAKLYSHTAAGVTSGTVLGTATFAAAAAAGTQKSIRVPAGTVQKYVGMEYSVVGSNMTTGAVDAWLSLDAEQKTA
jgi:hypothetical protein